jgi:hydrogenase expression/formation protein HypC
MNEEPDGVGGRPACIGDVCITCSDTAVEVRVLRLLEDQMAVVEGGAGEETVSVALVSAGVGDTILVHAREAIAVVVAPTLGTGPLGTGPLGTGP